MAKKINPEIKSLYYITHIANIPSIFKHGIFSHQLIEDKSLTFTPIYDTAIISNRQMKTAPDGNSLWKFANVYFQPRNPMLYRVLHEKGEDNIAILGINKQVMDIPGTYLTDGNAANEPTEFMPVNEGRKKICDNWKTIDGEWWNSMDGSKRKIMAECLVPSHISPDNIHTIFVAKHEIAKKIRAMDIPSELPIIPEPNMFFNPSNRHIITPTLVLVEGDMFFSKTQTLTVSVNTVGIMGKGLASRAKYQFPDLYVYYQDACRKKLLKMGKPCLYKRESSFDEELADEPASLQTPNETKWFLLFATKRHWKEDSDYDGIDEGLRWLVSNYKAEGIKSIALPALGCGLGKLPWERIGPLMCQRLSNLDIITAIYLPREKDIKREFLSPSYLLGSKKS